MIEGGWVCRACWHANGPREKRCYRCHTPRDQQLSVEAGSLKEKTEPGWELKGRLDADLSILAYLTVWPLRVLAVLEIGLGIRIFIGGLLFKIEGQPDVLGLSANTVISLFGLFLILLGSLQIFLANSVRRHARWAYVVVLLVSAGSMISTVIGLNAGPSGDDAAVTILTVFAWIYFAMALGSAALLLTSFVRREAGQQEPSARLAVASEGNAMVPTAMEPARAQETSHDAAALVDGSWVCRSCWHANRPGDLRCYRCHTPRVDQGSFDAGSVNQRNPTKPGIAMRLDADLPFLTLLATLPMRLYGTLAVGLGVLIVLFGVLSGGATGLGVVDLPVSVLVVIAVGISTSLYGFFLIFLANRVGRHARWAYIVAVLLFLGDSLPRLLGGVKPEFTDNALALIWLGSAWLSFGTGACAGTLLLTSFLDRSGE